MGLEIRNVPPNWKHPTRDCPHFHKCKNDYICLGKCYIPKYNLFYVSEAFNWYNNIKYFNQTDDLFYHESVGNPPVRDLYLDYDPSLESNTWVQLYETVSEGTPVSPAFATKKELADYLAEHGDFWDQRRSKEQLMKCEPWGKYRAYKFVFGTEWAPSFIFDNGKLITGVDFMKNIPVGDNI